MLKSCLGPQSAAVIAEPIGVSAVDHYAKENMASIGAALTREKIDVKKARFFEQVSYKSPLGNHPDDIEAWNGIVEAEPASTPKGFYTNEQRAAFKFKRLLRYMLKSCSVWKLKTAKDLLKRAKKTIGGGGSERQLKYDLERLRKTGCFIIEKSTTGSSHANVIGLTELGSRIYSKFFRCKKTSVGNPLYKSSSSINSNTPRRPTNSEDLKKLTFAIIQGRKSLEGFGQLYGQNDQGWKTIKELHWDNCKIAFKPKILFKTIYRLLEKGLRKETILVQYQNLLEKWHGIANDNYAIAAAPWQPSGIISEWREINQLSNEIIGR